MNVSIGTSTTNFLNSKKILNPELNSISCAVVGGCKKEAEKLEN